MTAVASRMRASGRRPTMLPWVPLVAVVVAVVFGVASQLGEPGRANLTIENPTAWTVGVEVIRDDGRLPIVHVRPETTRTVAEVLAPDGDTWHFRWTFNGQTVATTRVTVADLAAADHLLVVPDDVATNLREAQATPTP